MPNRISAAIGAIAVMCVFHGSANARPQPAAKAEDKAVAIERLVQSEMTARGIPGAQLTIVQRGKIVFTGAYGHANVEAATPVTKQTLFPINSISKAVAGVAAMQLVEAGKLDLDARSQPISTGFPKPGKALPSGSFSPMFPACPRSWTIMCGGAMAPNPLPPGQRCRNFP